MHKELRKDYLKEKLVEAVATGKTKKALDLRKKMTREENTKMWFCINRSQRDPRGKAITTVQKQLKDGTIVESSGKEETESMIFDENEYRFQLANNAPISKTLLLERLGYLVDTELAAQIVEGKFEAPDELDDATCLILEEIGRLGVQLTNGEVTITITKEEFQIFWS